MLKKTRDREQALPRVNPLAIAFSLMLGLILLGISVMNGQLWIGFGFLLPTWGFAAFLYYGSRLSDTVALISDDVQDERNVQIHSKAALYTLNLMAAAIVGAFVVDIARGGTGSPYTWLALFSAVTYISLLMIFSRRG
jgi:predicted MFS family arabinose efflux permease